MNQVKMALASAFLQSTLDIVTGQIGNEDDYDTIIPHYPRYNNNGKLCGSTVFETIAYSDLGKYRYATHDDK
jgi:hypothetical protein